MRHNFTTAEVLEKCYSAAMRRQINGALIKTFGHLPSDIEDLIQDVIIRLHRLVEAGSVEFDNDRVLQTYFAQSCVNMYIDRGRANMLNRSKGDFSARTIHYSAIDKAEDWLLSLADESDTEPTTDSRLIEVKKMLNELPDKFREPLELYTQGYDYEEIMQVLDLPASTIKSRISQAREKIRAKMSKRK